MNRDFPFCLSDSISPLDQTSRPRQGFSRFLGLLKNPSALSRTASIVDFFNTICKFCAPQLDFHVNYPLLAAKRERFEVGRMVLTHVGREVLERDRDVKSHDGMRITV
jgi:hypothetical protein